MSKPSPSTPLFVAVDDNEAQALLQAAGSRRDWSAIKELLTSGQRVFLPDDQLPESGVKYLSLAFARQVDARTLHVRKVTRKGEAGQLCWLGESRPQVMRSRKQSKKEQAIRELNAAASA